jgi:hypothetical protein
MTDAELIPALEAAALVFDGRAALVFDGRRDSFAIGKAAVCRDMVRRFRQYGRWASERQRNYAEALVRWSRPMTPRQQNVAEEQSAVAEANSVQREEAINANLMVARIVQLFAAASRSNLTRPSIRLRNGEWRIRIYPAPRHGRHPGDFYVRAASNTTRNLYCGRIRGAGDEIISRPSRPVEDAGRFFASSECPLGVIQALREFAENPLGVASAYGRAEGHCCFCGRGLTDGRSVAMGYGPVCAEHFGLAWGDQRARSVVRVGESIEQTVSRDISNALEQNVIGGVLGQSEVRRQELATRITAADARRYLERQRRAIPPAPRPVAERQRNEASRPGSLRSAPLPDEDEDSHFM